MDKAVPKNFPREPIQPVIPKTESNDGAYIDTLKQLQEEREEAK
jgi:hypothetical protein